MSLVQSIANGDVSVRNVHLPFHDSEQALNLWNVECRAGRVSEISLAKDEHLTHIDSVSVTAVPRIPQVIDAEGGLLLPSLCHSHIHLDKCFILNKCGGLVTGDFAEAMRMTKTAKSDFIHDPDDLYNRGARIVKESVENGVTAIRAHVEVDSAVRFACLEAAQRLKEDFSAVCDIQIAVFAQEPLFDSTDDSSLGENWTYLQDAFRHHQVDVIGSAPYVEPTVEQAKENIRLIFDLQADSSATQLDFHLDYNLDPGSEPLIYEVINQAKMRFSQSTCPSITIGHATRLQMFSAPQWRSLIDMIADFPIHFVCLPQSDVYMQGRAQHNEPLGAPRGTLRVTQLAKTYGVEVAMSVNNVENAFTPQGSFDPMSLCTFGVAIFQAATAEDISVLAKSVTIVSKRAIGLQDVPASLSLAISDPADFVIFHRNESLQSAVLNPCFERTTVKAGNMVASRRSVRWLLHTP
ncbi:hypothetical protein BJ165DRAFT_1187818 [Panaeolus papilionaceus]|nr:hypothetical protein BJ165DRAFT_1187818 [Panaeolus papilionaceus]